VLLSVMALIAGGVLFAASVGTTMRRGEIAALGLGLGVVAGAIAMDPYISARTIKAANEDAVRLAGQFGRLA
jgi:phosphoenolpyruvate synthase/pyruvate phosphate dikinase